MQPNALFDEKHSLKNLLQRVQQGLQAQEAQVYEINKAQKDFVIHEINWDLNTCYASYLSSKPVDRLAKYLLTALLIEKFGQAAAHLKIMLDKKISNDHS
jgi:hypothetical protein